MTTSQTIEKQTEMLSQFENDWRSIGWWAETVAPDEESDKFRAALFSPMSLEWMLEEDYKDRIIQWHRTPTHFRSPTELPHPINPSRFYMDDRNWAVENTAVRACGRAILIARSLYPETPTPKMFKHLVDMARPF
jgi:hypothetical protein